MCINNVNYNVAKCNLSKVKHRTCWPVASTSNHMQGSRSLGICSQPQKFYRTFVRQFILLTLPSHAFILAILPPALPPSGCVLVSIIIRNSPLRFSMWQCIVNATHRVFMVTFCTHLWLTQFVEVWHLHHTHL